MEYAIIAKEIAVAIQKADAEMKKRLRKMMKHRTLEDVSVLHTMLERVAESNNKQLKLDFEKHRIPERIKRNEGFWMEKQRVACAGGAVAGLLLLGAPTVYMGFIIADMQKHLSQMEKDLAFIVEEIESIFDQTNSLMLANVV